MSGDPRSIEANKKNLIEAYNYLGFYYKMVEKFDCSKAAFNKALELDSTNKTANEFLADERLKNAAGTCELFPAQTPETNGSGNE